MPSNKAVVDVIEQWSGQRPEKMSQSLEDWWNQTAPGSSHSALSFDPDGIEDLIKRIKNAFPSSPVVEAADFRASGNIKNVQDLVDALQPPMASDAMDVPVTSDTVPRSTRARVIAKRGASGAKGRRTKARAGANSRGKPRSPKATGKKRKSGVKGRPTATRKATPRKKRGTK
jgi:hypothetical protein